MGDNFSRLTITLESATVLADSKGRSVASIVITAGEDASLTIH